MKLLLFAALLALCVVGSATGQTYAYHDNANPSTGSVNMFPFGNSFGNNWRYQFTVPATALPTTPCRITELAFAPTTNAVFAVKDFQLRMAHASGLVLSSVFANNFASPPVAMIDVQGTGYTFNAAANKWTTLGVTTPFAWDGRRSLVIEVRYRGIGTLRQGTLSIQAYTALTNAHRVWANVNYPAPRPADPYSAKVGWTPFTTGGIKVRLTCVPVVLTLVGNPTPGAIEGLDLLSPDDRGRVYQLASSLGPGPMPLGQRTLGLTPDKLMEVTVNGYLPSIFVDYTGTLDAGGQARAQIRLPRDSRLKGVKLYSAFITFAPRTPLGISSISNTAVFSIL